MCGPVVGYQQEMPHLQSGHWNPTDPRQLIAHVASCSFGSGLVNSPSPPLLAGGALPNTPLSLCITQWACLLRQLRQRDQQSTLTYNTERWGVDAQIGGLKVVWTLLDVEGRSRHMWTDVLRLHMILSDCVPYVHLHTASKREDTLTTNLPSSVWCIKVISLPLYQNPYPL